MAVIGFLKSWTMALATWPTVASTWLRAASSAWIVGGIAASALLGLESRGVKLLGDVPQGLPAMGLPAIQWSDLNELLPLALACFLLGAVETAAIGRMDPSANAAMAASPALPGAILKCRPGTAGQ